MLAVLTFLNVYLIHRNLEKKNAHATDTFPTIVARSTFSLLPSVRHPFPWTTVERYPSMCSHKISFFLLFHLRIYQWPDMNILGNNPTFELCPGFPLGLENLEKWEGIFQSGKSQGILNRLEKSGKITQNTGKLREFQTNIIYYFLVIFKLTVYYFAEMHQIFSYKINF